MFGFLAAVGLAVGVGALLAFTPSETRSIAAPSPDLSNGGMVQRFNSYLFRTRRGLPAAAQAEIDGISSVLPALRQTLERIETLDPTAQDARRLMSIHLPGLIDRYLHVPAFIPQRAGWRRIRRWTSASSRASRRVEQLCKKSSEKLARADVLALETQGRFIQSRYASDGPEAAVPATLPAKDENGAAVDS